MLARKLLPLAQPQRGQPGRGRIGLQKFQRQLRRQVPKEVQHAGIILLESARELMEHPRLLAHEPRVIAGQEFDFLRGHRTRPQGREVRVIGAQKHRQDLPIKRITFRGTHAKPIVRPIQGFGIHGIHDHAMIQQTKSTTRPSGFSMVAHSSMPAARHSSSCRTQMLSPVGV